MPFTEGWKKHLLLILYKEWHIISLLEEVAQLQGISSWETEGFSFFQDHWPFLSVAKE